MKERMINAVAGFFAFLMTFFVAFGSMSSVFDLGTFHIFVWCGLAASVLVFAGLLCFGKQSMYGTRYGVWCALVCFVVILVALRFL
jgi:hypothetical protein